CANSYERNIINLMHITAVMGETVVLHCNGTLITEHIDTGWRKDRNLLFNYSPVINQTVINYTSSRMQVDPGNPRKLQISDVHLSDAGLYSCFPLNVHWRLTVEESEIQPLKERPFLIVFSITVACIAVGLLFLVLCLHGKWKKNSGDQTETTYELVKVFNGSIHQSETTW
ncbi:roundabout 2-like isoform X2, partial [Clarias magur]